MIFYRPDSIAVVYWYFKHNIPILVSLDKRNPIIPSIASLRRLIPDIPIYVVDVSNVENEWEDYPAKFNFTVTRKLFKFWRYKFQNDYGNTSRELLSKVYDCDELAAGLEEKYVAVVDSDLFWVQPPDLEVEDGFYINHNKWANSGLYLYNKDNEVIHLWKAINRLALEDREFRIDVLRGTTYDYIQEEATIQYILNMYRPRVKPLTARHNFLSSYYFYQLVKKVNLDRVTALHLLGMNAPEGNCLEVAYSITEIRHAMKEMFSERRFRQIFGEYEGKTAVSFKDQDAMRKLMINHLDRLQPTQKS